MPKQYTECVKSEVANGKKMKDAQRMCAISYFKQHGRTPQQDEDKSSIAAFSHYELALFEALPLIDRALEAKK